MFKTDLRKAAHFIIPLILISPSLYFGAYGIQITDILIITIGLLYILKGQTKIKLFFFTFLLLYSLGWLGSNVWGFIKFNINPQIAELNHLYRLFFYYSAYLIGFKSKYTFEEVLSSKFMRYIVILLGIFVIIYLSVDVEIKYKLMTFYAPKDTYLIAGGFPGLNSNINIFSFIIFIAGLFNFHYLLKGNKKLLLPSIILLFVIIAGLSRKNMAFLIVYIALVLIYTYFINPKSRILKGNKLQFKKFLLFIIVLIVCSIAGTKFLNSQTGRRIIASYKILLFDNTETEKLRSYYNIRSDFSSREYYMRKGMERVQLSPVLGAPKIRGQKVDDQRLLFHKAHNEFIVIWMYYGLLSIIGFIFFFSYLIIGNLRKKKYVWAYLYLILILQAFFDTAFFNYQLSSMLFIVIGLNFNNYSKH